MPRIIGVVLVCGLTVGAGLSSVPKPVGNETKVFFHFAAWKSSDSSCKVEVSHPFVQAMCYTNYPMMSLQCQISLWPLTKDFSLSFFILCEILRVLAEWLTRNFIYQSSRSLPDFRFSKTQCLFLLPLHKESNPELEIPAWAVILTLHNTSPLSFTSL